MAPEVTNYQCPACTGPLHFVGKTGKLQCDYCDSSYTVEEIEALYAATEEKNEEKQEQAEARQAQQEASGETEDPDWGQGMNAYNCPSCGAQLLCDETTAATRCPYCGNPSVVPGQFSPGQAPAWVVPFKLDEKSAKEALARHYRGKRLLPSTFAAENHIKELKGVYVPFWMYDGVADADVRFQATRTSVHRHGDIETRETMHFVVRRAGKVRYKRIPVDASTKMPNRHMDAIEPFDYRELKPFSKAYLPGFLADRYDVSETDSRPRAKSRAEQTALEAMKRDISGYHTCVEVGRQVNAQITRGVYALMPVYLLATKWNGSDFLFAMNGQTGKFVGDLPLDKKKYWAWLGGITGAVTAVLGTVLLFLL